jgi:hypothetical protein
MSKPNPEKNAGEKRTDEAAQAAREKELRELIERAEKAQSGNSPPKHESPHDFVQRKMSEKPKK